MLEYEQTLFLPSFITRGSHTAIFLVCCLFHSLRRLNVKEKGGKNISHCHFFLHTFFSILVNRLASLYCQLSPALSLRARGNWHFKTRQEDAHGVAVGCILTSQEIKKPSKISNPTVTKSNTITISLVRKTIYLSHVALKTEPNIPRVVQ